MATGLVSYVLGVPPAKQMGCLGRLDGGHPRYTQNQHNGHMELDVSSHHPPGAPLLPTSRPVGWLWRYKNRVHIFVLWNDPEVVVFTIPDIRPIYLTYHPHIYNTQQTSRYPYFPIRRGAA